MPPILDEIAGAIGVTSRFILSDEIDRFFRVRELGMKETEVERVIEAYRKG